MHFLKTCIVNYESITYSHRRHMSERFFRSYDQDIRTQYILSWSGIRVAVGDCSITERRRWRPPYRTGKTLLAGDQWWPFFVTFYFFVTDILCLVIQYFGSKN